MTPEDIKKFKEETADRVLKKVLDAVELKEGQTIIDGIRITVSDGRSYGFDTLFQLKGLTISNGEVVDFAEEFTDVPMEEFLTILSQYIILGYGDFCAKDDQRPLEVHTTIKNAGDCISIFKDLKGLEKIKYVNDCPEYEKMLKMGFGIDVTDFVSNECTETIETPKNIDAFAKQFVKAVAEKNYEIKVEHNGYYGDITFLNKEYPKYDDYFGIAYSPATFISDNDICQYKVWCKITASEIMQTNKEDFFKFINHRDTLQEFVDMLNDFGMTYTMLRDKSFFIALKKEIELYN